MILENENFKLILNSALRKTDASRSMLYPNREDVKYSVDVKTSIDGKINLLFSCDGGKFGTDEILDEYNLSAKELLEILQNKEYTEQDIERAYKCGESKSTFYKRDTSVILPSNYEGVDG